METLPLEILVHIFTYVGDRPILSVVSRMWRDAYVIAKRQINKPMTYSESISESYECATQHYHCRQTNHGEMSRYLAKIVHGLPVTPRVDFNDTISSIMGLYTKYQLTHEDIRVYFGKQYEGKITTVIFAVLCASGNLPALIRVIELNGLGSHVPPSDFRMIAARNGHIHILKWFSEIGGSLDGLTMDCAATFGQTETVAWLRDRGCPWSASTCYGAATNGRLETLKWLCAHDCPLIDDITSCEVIDRRQFKVLRWMFEHGYARFRFLLYNVAATGDLETVKWLYERGARLPKNEHVTGDEFPRHVAHWMRSKNLYF